MISGTITLEDTIICFNHDADDNSVTFTVTDLYARKQETRKVDMHKFFKALAIAVHADGEPNAELDYPDAESVMGEIRWIP